MKTQKPKPMRHSKSNSKRTFIAKQTYLSKQEKKKITNKQPNFTPKATRERTNKIQSQQKEIIKIRAEIETKDEKDRITQN